METDEESGADRRLSRGTTGDSCPLKNGMQVLNGKTQRAIRSTEQLIGA